MVANSCRVVPVGRLVTAILSVLISLATLVIMAPPIRKRLLARVLRAVGTMKGVFKPAVPITTAMTASPTAIVLTMVTADPLHLSWLTSMATDTG